MKRHFFLSLLIVLCCLMQYSCSKNKTKDKDCYDFPLPKGTGFGYNLKSAPIFCEGAFFKQGSSDDFLYNKEIDTIWPQIFLLHKSQLSNPNNFDSIPVMNSLFPLSWNKNGWILFWSLFGREIYKIKENGDSFTKINTFTTDNIGADWRPDGKRIVFVGSENRHGFLYLINPDGSGRKIIDSSIVGHNPTWSPDGTKIAYSGGEAIFFTDTLGNKIKFENVLHLRGGCRGISWFPDSQWLTFDGDDGLYKLNTQTGATIQLRTSCDSRMYAAPSVSADGSKIIFTRTDGKLLQDGGTIYQSTYNGIMNADGTNEQRLNVR